MRILLLGAVTRPHGLGGEVQILPFHPDSPRWAPGEAVRLIPPGVIPRDRSRDADVVEVAEAESVEIEAVRSAPKGRLVVRLSGVGHRDRAEALVGGVLGVEPDALEEDLGDAEFWFFEVPGWEVVAPDGSPLGTVVRALGGHTDLFEVRPTGGGETFYVPVVDDVVKEIDRDRGRVVVDPIEGLLP